MVCGIEFFRRKQRISVTELSKRSGIAYDVLRRMIRDRRRLLNAPTHYFTRLADVLGTSIEALTQEYSESELADGDRTAYPSHTGHQDNCIAIYRDVMGLSLEQLGQRMGNKTKECARQACAAKEPKEAHIKVIADYEGITPEEFRRRYQPNHRDDK